MTLAWHPWYPGDYARDTMDLSCCEHGCYRLLLDAFWATGPLEDDLDRLQRLAAAAPAETVRFILQKYWSRNESGRWVNQRMEITRKEQIEKHERRVLAGRKGGNQKASNATAKLEQCSSNQNQNQNHKNTTGKRETPKGRTNVPYKEIKSLYHEILPEFRAIHDLTTARKTGIRQRWQNELPDMETWKEYFMSVRKSDFLMGRCAPSNGRSKPFQADLDWLIKPSNLVKIAEGKYHGQ